MSNSGRPPGNGRVRSRGDENAIVNHSFPRNNQNPSGEGSDGKENGRKDEAAAPKPGPKLAQTKIQVGMRLKRWMIISRIGAGSFGETFSAIDVGSLLAPLDPVDDPLTVTPEARALLANLPEPSERKEVCIKVEQENKNVLRLEALALKKVQPCSQVVRYLSSGCTNGMNYLVMEKLGPNLAELRRRSPHGTFNIYTTLRAGVSCLQAIRGVHEQGLLHRDIKPSNFVTGLPGTEEQATCFIIDFGLARRYRRSSGEIRPPRENAGFRGTSRYASVTSHHHQELGRVDDLWSLLFMLVEFATGTLPWRKYKDKEDIGRCKEESITPHLVRNLPREFQPFLAHLQTLRYEDEPDYDLLLALMQRSLERRGYPQDKPLDWELDPSMLEAADGEVAVQPPHVPHQLLPPPPLSSPHPPPPALARRSSAGTGGHADGAAPASAAAAAAEGLSGAPRGPPPLQSRGRAGSGAGRAGSSPSSSSSSSVVGGGKAAEAVARPHASGNGLRVSEVEVSYHRSQLNEENRSNQGGSLLPAQGGWPGPQSSVGIPAEGPRRRHEDGSETPAVHASSSSHGAEEDGDGREFSPREAGSHSTPPPRWTSSRVQPASGREDLSLRPAGEGKALPFPNPSAGGGGNSLDAVEHNAAHDPSSPPALSQGKAAQGPGSPAVGKEKKAKSKSKCSCALM